MNLKVDSAILHEEKSIRSEHGGKIMVLIITTIVYALVPGVIGHFGLKAARKGESKSNIFLIVMDAIAVLANLGAYVQYGSLGIEDLTMLLVAVIYTILIISAKKQV